MQRYAALRNDNAYTPEENYVRGGEALDNLCDCIIKWGNASNFNTTTGKEFSEPYKQEPK